MVSIKTENSLASVNYDLIVPETFRSRSYPREKFIEIVRWAMANHPFYQERFRHVHEELPLLTRMEILENNEKLLNGHPVTATTSGSTGVPVKVSWCQKKKEIEQLAQNRFVGWLGGKLPVLSIIYTTTPNATGLDVSTPVAKQISHILKSYKSKGTLAITTYPSNAERLCRYAISHAIDMPFIKRVGVYAEVFEPYQEDLIKEVFPNAQIWSTYSSQEMGLIACRCPFNPEYHHVMAGKLGVEILNENNEPCADGIVGRIVVTDFFNYNAPFIRYDIGDLAAWGQCPCGKIALPSFSKVLGKVRGALLHKNGERIPFTHLSVALRDLPGMCQYQVKQNQIDQFDVRIVHIDQKITPILREQIERCFFNHFGYSVTVNLILEQTIERGANGKFYASICHL